MNEKIIAWLMETNQANGITRFDNSNSTLLVSGNGVVYKIFTGISNVGDQLTEASRDVFFNRILAPHRFFEKSESVVKIVESGSSFEFTTLENEDHRNTAGYILRMRPYSPSLVLQEMVKTTTLGESWLQNLGTIVGKFHASLLTETSNQPGDTTTIAYFKSMIDEEINNFMGNQEVLQLLDCIKLELSKKTTKITHTIYSRVDCVTSVHGDMRLHNIVIMGNAINILNLQWKAEGTNHDVAKDVGDILSGLYFYGRHDLAKIFLESYIHATVNNTINFVVDYWVAFASFRNGIDLLGKDDRCSNKMGVSYLKQAIAMLEKIEQ